MKLSMKFPMNLALACSAVLLMGGVSAQAATQTSTSGAESICASAEGAQDPMCQKVSQDDQANLTRWGRGGWHRGGGWGRGRGGWGRGPARGWCYWHPRAPRCRF